MLVVGTTIVVPELEGAQLMFQISQNWEVPNLVLLCPRTGRCPTRIQDPPELGGAQLSF